MRVREEEKKRLAVSRIGYCDRIASVSSGGCTEDGALPGDWGLRVRVCRACCSRIVFGLKRRLLGGGAPPSRLLKRRSAISAPSSWRVAIGARGTMVQVRRGASGLTANR